MIKVAVEKALEKHRAGQGVKLDRRTTIERGLSLIEAKQEHLVDAIAAGDKDRRILDRLRVEETRREELIRELEQLETAADVGSLDEARLKRELKTRLANMRGLLERHVSSARRLLRRLLKTLLEQPLRFEAVQEGNRRAYRVLGTGSYLPLLPELPTPVSAEESLLPGQWCPQRDYQPFNPTSRPANRTIFWRNQDGCIMKGNHWVMRRDGFRCGRSIAQRTVRTNPIIGLPPAVHETVSNSSRSNSSSCNLARSY